MTDSERIETAISKLNDWIEWQGKEISLMPENTMGEISRKNSALQAIKAIADIADTM